jgi:hypothetical protein
MIRFKPALDFYINSSIHVALAVLSFCILTVYEFELEHFNSFYTAVFCASVSGYNFVKYFGLTKFYYRSLTTRLKYIQLVSFLSFMGFVVVFFQLHQNTQILFVFLALITFFYAIPMGFKTPKNLRSIGGVKIYIIAFVWAMTTVVLPVLESNLGLNMDHWILVVQRTFIVIVLMLPFEIRDLDEDHVHLSTIPQKIGIKNTKLIGYALLGDSILLELFKHQFNQNNFLTVCFISVLTAVFLSKSNKQQGRYYAAFWVEVVPVLALIFAIVLILVQKAGSF